MKRSALLKSSIILIGSILLLSSCTWVHKREAPRGKNIICVVDFSDSKNATERLQFYMNVIKDNIIQNLGLYDKITVIPIDKASITNSTDILLKDLSAKIFEPDMASPLETEQLIKDNLKKYKDTLVTEFTKSFQAAINLRNKSNHGSDIFGALEIVKGKLKTGDNNYIIILSDMMNWSSTLNMEPDNKGFNYRTLDEILSKVPHYEMPNATALVLTAEQVEVSPEHFKLVQTFWTKYFEINHIKLFDYNSASISQLNELMSLPVTE